MKKLIYFITALALLGLCSCGADTESAVSKDASSKEEASVLQSQDGLSQDFSEESVDFSFEDPTADNSTDSFEEESIIYSGDYGYTLVNTVAMLCRYKGSETKLELPSELDGYTLTAVTDEAFASNSKLKSIKISDTVVNIGDTAFDNCTALEYVYLGSSVAVLNTKTFESCSALKEIEVSAANKNYSSADGVLYNGDKTELLRCPCAIEAEELEVPDTVACVGEYAFSNCSGIKKVTLPDGCQLKTGSFFYCMDMEEIVFGEGLTAISEKCFFGCVMLKEIEVPGGVTFIGDYAYFGCISATGATLPESVTEIGKNVFKSCSALKKIKTEGDYLKEWYEKEGKNYINS